MELHNLIVRVKTKMAQQLPSDLEIKVTKFLSYVIKLRKQESYELSYIGKWTKRQFGWIYPLIEHWPKRAENNSGKNNWP